MRTPRIIAQRCHYCGEPVEYEPETQVPRGYLRAENSAYVILLNNQVAHVRCLPKPPKEETPD